MNVSWKRLLLPNIAVVIFLIFSLSLFKADNSFLTDPATSRHLKAGEILLQRGKVFKNDPFTFYNPPLKWIDFEWLFELIIAGLLKWGGLPFLYGLAFLSFGLIPIMLWRFLITQKVSWPIAFLYTLATLLFFRAHLLLRPFLCTYIFMLVVIWIWHNQYRNPNRLNYLFLPLLFAFWSNLHSGFVAALLFLGLSLVGRIFDQLQSRHTVDRSVLNWGILIFLSALATLLNPYGWHLHEKIFQTIFELKSLSALQESAAPDFHSFSALTIALILIGGTLISDRMRRNPVTKSWEVLLPIIVFLYFALNAQRHILLLTLIASLPVCKIWQSWLPNFLKDKLSYEQNHFAQTDRRSLSHWWMIPLLTSILILCFIHSDPAKSLRVAAYNVTPGMISYLENHRSEFRRPLTSTWNAGPLIYYLPDFKISFDDRADLLGDRLLQPYLQMVYLKPGWERILTTGNYDSAILEKGLSLTNALKLLPGWKVQWQDAFNTVFVYQP